MFSLLTVIFFALGLIIGSFLNVVILRLNTKKTLGGRSACMVCQRELRWYELIPVFSFFTLQGRCRTCKTKISIQYPLVELTSGIIFALIFLKFSTLSGFVSPANDWYVWFSPEFLIPFLFYATAFSILLVIAVYDLRHKIIPDLLAFIFGVLAFIGLFLFSSYNLYLHVPSVWEFLAGPFIALPFAFFWLVSRGRWMGLGDAKLGLGIGWLLGLTGALSGLVIAFWVGAIVGVALIIISKSRRKGRMGMKSEIPFAPFLVLGTFLAFMCGFNFFGL